MNLLLDTHVLLWSLQDAEKLSPGHRAVIENPSNRIWVSSISIWEVVMKVRIGKLTLDDDLSQGIADQDFELLSFGPHHAYEVQNLPLFHKDPFDRALLAQARTERLSLLSDDRDILRYSEVVDILPA